MYSIEEYEIRNSTLEEVFIRLGQMEKKQEEIEEEANELQRENY